jgi:glycosyltransferase involved in cell wall biosynthesis
MKRPTLSIVVPNYNHGHYLPACLDSILTQSWQPDELMVIDDASTDNSVEVIERYQKQYPQIRLHRNERNRGVLWNLNWGMEQATGDFIYFPGADDVLLPGLFEKSMKMLAEHPEAGACCGIGDWRESATGWRWFVGVGLADRPTYFSPDELVRLDRAGKLFIATNTVMARRTSLLEAGRYNGDLKWHADWFIVHVAAFRGGLCYVPEPLGIFNIHPTSFFKRGRNDPAAHREVLTRILDQLALPQFADVRARVVAGGTLFEFGWPMLRLLLSDRRHRDYLTPVYLRKTLAHITKLVGRKFTPGWLARWYFRYGGYWVKDAPPVSPASEH